MWEQLTNAWGTAGWRMRQVIYDIAGDFLRDRQGVAAVFFVLALVPISAAAGAAIDISRAYLVKHRLGTAIDAAGLAVGASSGKSEAELTQILNDYFKANYPAEELGVPATPVMVIEDSVIKISAKASVDTTLMAAGLFAVSSFVILALVYAYSVGAASRRADATIGQEVAAVEKRFAEGGPGLPIAEGGLGYSCLAEQRTVEVLRHGAARSPFLRAGDRVRIEMLDAHGHSIFGAIDQRVVAR